MNDLRGLGSSDQTNVRWENEDGGHFVRLNERVVSALVLLVIAIFTFFDLIEDRMDGAPWTHVVGEAIVVIAAVILAGYLFRRSRAPLIEKNRALELQLVQARNDAIKWRKEASQYVEGLSAAIASQLRDWNLSEAESDIAMLLLKGLSHKEIATLRNTSERTVRQQATSVYQKSGLSGRSELSAFFLEDLLAPPRNNSQTAN